MSEKSLGLNLKITYIHAEKLMEEIPPKIQVNIQLNVPSGEVKAQKGSLQIPFVLTLNTIPSVATMTLKGHIVVIGEKGVLEEVKRGIKQKKPTRIMPVALQHLMLETMIIGREIGLPPILIPTTLPPGKPPNKQEPSSMIA